MESTRVPVASTAGANGPVGGAAPAAVMTSFGMLAPLLIRTDCGLRVPGCSGDAVARRQVIDGLSARRERAGHLIRAVDPQDRHGLLAAIAEGMLRALRNVGRVVRLERCQDAFDLDLGEAPDQGHLLIAVVRVPRCSAARWIDADAGR